MVNNIDLYVLKTSPETCIDSGHGVSYSVYP
jgi:hypothetical protein